MNTGSSTIRTALCAGVLALTALSPALANEDEASKAAAAAETAAQSQADEQVAQKRQAIVEEAKAAIRETHAALAALDAGNADEALAALERATGKLEIVIARDPALALATTDVSASAIDVVATLEEIKAARDQAESYLEDGEVQKARRVLEGLASEIVVSVTKLPLATYPDAIRAAAALIDRGETDAAASALRAALNTLVISEHVIPLPLLTAEAFLDSAEALAENDSRTDEESERLAQLIEGARSELKLAEALGYGSRKDYAGYYAELKKIERATRGQRSGKGLFDEIRGSLGELRGKLFD